MWVVTHIPSGSQINLIPERKKYEVGRFGSDIVLADDTSISRSHAVFHIRNDVFKLEDKGSKYGTYLNHHIETKTKLPKGNLIELKEGDRILFGALKNEWLISKNNINTMVSSLNGPQTTEVKNIMNLIGGSIISHWEPKCTHLTMSEATITIKVLYALIEKIPIVSCEYWKDLYRDALEAKQPPKASQYLPKRSSSLSSAIDVASFCFNDKRKTLFAGKTFVFMTKKHFDIYSPIVIKAGGKSIDLNSNVHKKYLLQKDVIVVQYLAQSQGSQTINTISEYLEANSLRTIPEYEIGLAIVCCTIEKYCNPSYQTIAHVLSNFTEKPQTIESILAENTRPQKSQLNTLDFSIAEIPDSDYLNDKAATSKPLYSEIYEDNKSEYKIITIENSENSEEAYILRTDSKRKRENVSNEQYRKTSKKVNVSNESTSGENPTDTGEFSKEIPLCLGSVDSRDKRKAKPADGDNLQSCKKTRWELKSASSVNNFANPSKRTSTSNIDVEKSKKHKLTESAPNVNKPLSKTIQTNKKAIVLQEKRFSGYLETSQINCNNRVMPAQISNIDKISESTVIPPTKRSRIAHITDNDSDNDDDIFNFGSSPKRSRAPGQNTDEILFAFGSKPLPDAFHRTTSNREDLLMCPQPIVSINRIKSTYVIIPTKNNSPPKSTSEGWLSKINTLKIKTDDAEVKTKSYIEDSKPNEWKDSIRGFKVRVRKMNLLSKESNITLTRDASNSTLNTSKKNFKAFVKKHNYKQQTCMVRTVPMVIPSIH